VVISRQNSSLEESTHKTEKVTQNSDAQNATPLQTKLIILWNWDSWLLKIFTFSFASAPSITSMVNQVRELSQLKLFPPKPPQNP